MASEDLDPIHLGFVEKCERPWLLRNIYFPNKVGGKPAWLELKNLPKNEDILCPKCNKPRIFLCQIYAPIESRDDCFHRTIYVFVCKNESCYESNSSKNIVVFRSQLPRHNDYYSPEPHNEEYPLPEIKPLVKLCHVCGCHGQYACSKCKKINYCSKEHQVMDWKSHKTICNNQSSDTDNTENQNINSASTKLLFTEYIIFNEPEEIEELDLNKVKNENEEINEKKRLQEYDELVKSGKAGDLNDVHDLDLIKYVKADVEDKYFEKFREQIKHNPEQVIRYQRNGQPLWVSKTLDFVEKNQIPNCEYCNSKRIYEFSIMPQLLNYLNCIQIDWGILAIYTCSQNCDTKSQYLKEFVVKQDLF